MNDAALRDDLNEIESLRNSIYEIEQLVSAARRNIGWNTAVARDLMTEIIEQAKKAKEAPCE